MEVQIFDSYYNRDSNKFDKNNIKLFCRDINDNLVIISVNKFKPYLYINDNLENIKQFKEADRKYRRDESIRKSLNPALGYSNTTAINTVNSRVERLEEDVSEIKDTTKKILNMVQTLTNRKGGKRKSHKKKKSLKRKSRKARKSHKRRR